MASPTGSAASLICAAVFASDQRAGLFGGIGCLVALGASVTVAAYSFWIGLAGGVVLLGVIGWVAGRLLAERRATEELVATVEAAKQAMRPPARRYLFGNAAVPGHVDVVQSPPTLSLVKAVRRSGRVRTAKSVVPVVTD